MDPHQAFRDEVAGQIRRQGRDPAFRQLSLAWTRAALQRRYSYNFSWLGRPVIQFPTDIWAIQELIWRVRPQLVIETGIAHGGSLILEASMLQLLGNDGRVLGVDIDIRAHNRQALAAHPLAARIDLIEGSSIDPQIIAQVHAHAASRAPVLLILDSHHTHDHVLAELHAYAPLVRRGSYIVVFDTIIEDLPPGSYPDRPWDVGNNPRTAVRAFLKACDRFQPDEELEGRLLITTAPEGFLRCVRDPA